MKPTPICELKIGDKVSLFYNKKKREGKIIKKTPNRVLVQIGKRTKVSRKEVYMIVPNYLEICPYCDKTIPEDLITCIWCGKKIR